MRGSRRQVIVLGLLAILLFANGSSEAIGPIRIESFDAAFWDSAVVLVAKVEGLVDQRRVDGRMRVRLAPIATLSGAVDPGVTPTIEADLYVGLSSMIAEPPEAGASVLVLLRRRETQTGSPHPDHYVEPNICRFMPGATGLVNLDRHPEVRLSDVATAIRKLRGDAKSQRVPGTGRPGAR